MLTQCSSTSVPKSAPAILLAAASAVFTLLAAWTAAAQGLVVNSFPNASSVAIGNSPGLDWVNFRNDNVTVAWDPNQRSPSNPNPGAMRVTVNWPSPGSPGYTAGRTDLQLSFNTSAIGLNEQYNSSTLLAFDCDIKVDVTNSYTATDGSYGSVELVVNPFTVVTLSNPLKPTNGWQHFTGYFSAIPNGNYVGAVIGFVSGAPGVLTNQVTYWIDNIVFSKPPQSAVPVDTFDGVSSVTLGNSPGLDWTNYNGENVSVSWDPARTSPNNPNSGSMYVTVNWPGQAATNFTPNRTEVQFSFSTATVGTNEIFNSTNYVSFDCDIMVDLSNSYPAMDGSYGSVELAVNPWNALVLGAPLLATGGWQHFSGYFSSIPDGDYMGAALSLISQSPGILTNRVSYWIDNLVFIEAPPTIPTQPASVLTYHNDNARTGQNTNEIALTPTTVNTNTFGLLFNHAVDGYVCAAPLVMTNVLIPGKGQHNVVFVATEHDSVYAFDADSDAGTNASPLWATSFLNIANGVTAVTPAAVITGSFDVGTVLTPSLPEVGITGTPVIDPVTGTLYVEAETQELVGGLPVVLHRLHALDVGTGEEKFGGPVEIAPTAGGVGDDSIGGVVSFNGANQFNGSALLLANGNVYVGFSSPDDTPPFHGWLLSFNAQTLQPTGVFNTTPNGSGAGIWMSGGGPAADAAGNIYLTTYDGTFNTNYDSAESDSLGGSFVKLETTNGLAEADYFRPYNESADEKALLFLGATGVTLLPDSAGSAAHPHLMVSSQESGAIYLVDRDSLGGFNAAGDSQIPQEYSIIVFTPFNGTPAYFNNQLFFQGLFSNIRSVYVTNGQMSYAGQSSGSFLNSCVPVVSANGTSNGIVWVVQYDNYATGGPAVLYAYNANNLMQELYDSSQAPLRDSAFPAVQFTSPTVAGGKVYVGGQYGLSVYGVGPFAALPVITPSGGVLAFTNSETVTITANTPGGTIYFTLDGSIPTTNSQVYEGPFTVTNSVIVNALNFAPGYVASAAQGPTLINVSTATAQAPGLVVEAVYPGATRTQLESPSYTNPPAYIRHLPSFETTETEGGYFAETLTGWFTPPQTGNYVFFVASGADADLFLSTDATSANLHLIAQETSASNVRSWLTSYAGSVVSSKRSDQFAGTTWPGGNTITLTAGVPYLLKAVHHSVPSYVSTFAATYKLAGAPDPVNGTPPTLTGSVLSGLSDGAAAISVSSQPQNVVVYAGDEAEFTVQASAVYFADASGGSGPPISYQWQSAQPGSASFTNIAGATQPQFVTPLLTTGENGYQYQVALSAPAAPTVISSIAAITVKPPITAPAYNSVLTWHYDNARTGLYTNEMTLTPANVNSNTFGVLTSHVVDGYVYAEPLVLTNVLIPGLGAHNVLFVVTDHDSVYAFDADSVEPGTNSGLLWQTSFINPAAGVTIVEQADFNFNFTGPAGIIATPVIDPVSGTIYIEAMTKEISFSGTNYIHRLHALDVTTGNERSNSPVVIQCTNYPGTGAPGFADNDGNGHVAWQPLQLQARPALLLAGGSVYVSYASYSDAQPYHGWILGYDAATLTNTGVFNVTPNGASGGIWNSGAGLAADQYNNIYTPTGNGDFGTNSALASSYNLGESVIKLTTTNGLALNDYFTPYNQALLTSKDADISSAGVMLLPTSAGSAMYPHLMVGCAKEGKIYLLNRDSLGHYNSANDNQIVQEVPNANSGTWASPAYFNNMIYYQAGALGGAPDVLKAFAITNGQISPTPVTQSLTPFNYPGATPVISANGGSNAIAWVLQEDSPQASPCVLHAYNATNLSQELYNSLQAGSRDLLGIPVKATIPTVFNGKVYVGTAYQVYVLGNSSFIAEPVISPAGGLFTNSVTITLGTPATNVSMYYTLDGSRPTTNSTHYTGPFALTNTALVQAVAALKGAYSSIASASFVNTAAAGDGTGLLGQYYAGIFPTNIAVGTPLMVRTDAVINFNWTTAPPAPALGYLDYSIVWSGLVRPQYTENYTFTVTADDGVFLSINGQPLILQWHDGAPATWSATIPMESQQYYNIVLSHYQDQDSQQISLSWQSPSTPLAIVPQSQLYPLTNPPPVVALTAPAPNASYTASAAITMSAVASDQFNDIACIAFYTNAALAGVVSNAPYTLTITGVPAGSYSVTAVASDTVGVTSSSAPVQVTVAAGTGARYGLVTNATLAPFLNQSMPGAFNGVFTGTIPTVLSKTGTYPDVLNRVPSGGLLPYSPNTILWSDGATKSRYLALPNNLSPIIPSEQIGFAPTGQWTFPSGTIFVKNFDLVVNTTNAGIPLRRLETRLLVRDTNGSVYGVTYKWRPDNSDADLLTNSLTEAISITNATGVTTQNWYYPSPADCLTCHTPIAGYVLGVNARQLNGTNFYPASGVSDNQLRTLNRLGVFNPAFDEAAIATYEYLSAITNTSAPLVQRARSYLDANCAQCHQPGGTGPTFDARYDTPLTNQNIIGTLAAKANFGYNNVDIVSPNDIWRSAIYQRINTVDPSIKMPPLARNTIDTNAVAVFEDWINSLPGTPAEAPPTIAPAGGVFGGTVTVAITPPDGYATIYYTLDGSLPTTNSEVYTGPFALTASATVSANAVEPGLITSVAPSAAFTIVPGVSFVAGGTIADGYFIMQMAGPTGQPYTIQTSTNLINWTTVFSITPDSSPFFVAVPQTTNSHARFYRATQLP